MHVMTFLRETKEELQKTSFPDKKMTIRNTITVILFSIGAALFFGGLDLLFVFLLNHFVLNR